MGRQRDPNRDKAKDIYIASKGEINLIDIATQLGVGDGTVRGWKAKDKWENLLTGEAVEQERSKKKDRNAPKPEQKDEDDGEQDELFLNAVLIVVEAQQASTSLLQRRMRIGYTSAARLIHAMELRGFVSPSVGSEPRKVLIKEFNPGKPASTKPNRTERNAPKKETERSNNMERSKRKESPPVVEEEPEPEIPDDEGLTPKQRIFVMEYLRDFNATRAAIAAGYSKKTAYQIGFALLKNVDIQNVIKRHSETALGEIGMNVQRVLLEYMKIAFTDITDLLDFGQKDEPLFTDEGPAMDPMTGEQMTYKRNFVAFKNSDEVDGTVISEVKQGKDGVSIKLHDKMKALDALTKYIDLLPDKHKRMIEEEKLKLDKERFEFEKVKAAGEGDLDEEIIDDWVEAVMDDGEDGGDEETISGIQEEDTGIS
ncbi:cell division protein FtsK [Cohnella kolymensis]|uniref:Cell division protein FtsK n=1 Tax=Cohnella kolymensis TaxID=1590652 RepID=A0ABR5A3N2_9BACL|nr:terminase small subunit [Cohnella kolymensis]KIL35155.1 cell division protein FtsK [Cohnella kolymensis]